MRLSGKSKLLKKTPVGAASSRELKRSRLEAAPTISKITGVKIFQSRMLFRNKYRLSHLILRGLEESDADAASNISTAFRR